MRFRTRRGSVARHAALVFFSDGACRRRERGRASDTSENYSQRKRKKIYIFRGETQRGGIVGQQRSPLPCTPRDSAIVPRRDTGRAAGRSTRRWMDCGGIPTCCRTPTPAWELECSTPASFFFYFFLTPFPVFRFLFFLLCGLLRERDGKRFTAPRRATWLWRRQPIRHRRSRPTVYLRTPTRFLRSRAAAPVHAYTCPRRC